MRRKVLRILKWFFLGLSILSIISGIFVFRDSFSDVENLKRDLPYIDREEGNWCYKSIENYRKSILIGLAEGLIVFAISLLSIYKNNKFWNICFILLMIFLVFNMIKGCFSYN